MATLVMKFGGSLTADARRIIRVAQVITAESLAWDRLVVIVSAMAGVTDTLGRMIEQAAARDTAAYRRTLTAIREEHITIVETLFDNEALRQDLIRQIDRILFDTMSVCDAVIAKREVLPRDRDVVMAAGERLIVQILTALVRQEGLQAAAVDAASIIVTDDRHLSANPLIDMIEQRVEQVIRPILDAGIVPIITGFIGMTRGGVVTTLGRGGSDYTATILAASLHADEVWMWTSVDGVMSADPALVPTARVIPVLSYNEVGEMSYFGAHIVHPRAVEPLLAEKIPLRVRNPFNMDHAGTLIQDETYETEMEVGLKAVTAVDGLFLSTEGRSIDAGEVISQVHRLVGKTATGPVILMQSHEQSLLVFVVPTTEGPLAAANAAQKLKTGLGADKWDVRVVKVIAVMGTATPTAMYDLNKLGLKPLASTINASGRRLMAVTPSDVQPVVRELHKLASQGAQRTTSWG
jgi:aspartate kinase